MSQVLVVSRTRMTNGHVCVGGHDLENGFRGVRLLREGRANLREEDPIAPSQVWELEYTPLAQPDPPHVEDVIVSKGKRVKDLPISETRRLILANDTPWSGAPDTIFDRTVKGTPSGRVYVPEDGVLPTRSTGYWLPDDVLLRNGAADRPKYRYQGVCPLAQFTWAGMSEAPLRIEPGTLVRASLARHWEPDWAPAGYYVQISDVY